MTAPAETKVVVIGSKARLAAKCPKDGTRLKRYTVKNLVDIRCNVCGYRPEAKS